MSHRVGIIGGGFVGRALAESLNKSKYKVKLSFRSNKPESLILGVEYFYCDVQESTIKAEDPLFEVDSLVICIPPGFRQDMGDSYTAKIKSLVEKAESSNVKQVIFTSSIGIYSKDGINDENTDLDLSVNKVRVLHSAEQTVLQSRLQYKQVLRLGGLIGGSRHPGRFKVPITQTNANEAVNMVMLQDVVGSIETVIEDIKNNEVSPQAILNVVAPHHPNKQSFYRYARQKLNALDGMPIINDYQPADETQNNSGPIGRVVQGNQITKVFAFKYQVDSFFTAF